MAIVSFFYFCSAEIPWMHSGFRLLCKTEADKSKRQDSNEMNKQDMGRVIKNLNLARTKSRSYKTERQTDGRMEGLLTSLTIKQD